MNADQVDSAPEVESLWRILRALRDPQTGCAWDRRQTLPDLVTPLLDEARELAEALQSGDADAVREEAGDLLWNVLMVLQVAQDAGAFRAADVVGGVAQKMIRRHPHVFGGEEAATLEDARRTYQEAKRREKELS